MTPAPGFFLHHGNDLPELASVLGLRLADAGHADWLRPDTVLIPQPSMRRWLQNSLAEQFGIAANLDFRLPGQLLDRVLQPWLPLQDPDRLLNHERIRWRLFALLMDDNLLENPAFLPLKRFLGTGNRQQRIWQLAGESAQAFEKYQAWRREWLLSWQQKAEPHDWQSVLWHLASQGRSFRAQAVEAYLNDLANPNRPRPSDLPDRLFVFACQNLSPDVVRILQSFGRWIRVEFFLHNPCQAYWGDSGRRKPDSDILAMAFDNPLLDQWGYAGRDFICNLLSEQNAQWLGEAEHYLAPETTVAPTLLQLLQEDVLNREAPRPGRMTRQTLLSDTSVQIHCCAGALREVQMLRGQLLALMRQNPSLQWRDIAIMAPELDRFAPFFAPVFGHSDADYPALPFALSETATASGGLRELMFRILALANSRFTGNDGLELLSHRLLAEGYGLGREDLERVFAWLEQAGVRWGLDAGHRQAIDGVAQFAFTWRFAMQRLLYGYASSDALVDGVAPVAMPSGKDRELLDILLAFTGRIETLRTQFSQKHKADAWREILQDVLAWLADGNTLDDDDRDFSAHLGRLCADLDGLADNAGLTQAFGIEVVSAWLTEALEPRLGQAWLSGRITLCKMVPMRLIPFKVICVLGMDEGAFPRREPVAAINRLADRSTAKRLGDRSNRNDDRFLMLQLLSSCQAHWIISYSGLDPVDGSISPPAIVVQELLQTIAGYGPADADMASALTIRHPIHAFETPSDSRIAVAHAKAPERSHAAAVPALFAELADIHAGPAPESPVDVALEEFTGFWRNPIAALAHRRNIRWQWHDALLEEAEPLGEASGLARYRLVQAITVELLDNPEADPERLRQRLQAEGVLAPGRIGSHGFLAVLAEIRPALDALSGDTMTPVRFELEHARDNMRIHGRLVQRHHCGIVLPALHRDDMTAKTRVAAGLQALLAKACAIPVAICVRTATRLHDLSFSGTPEQARDRLDTLLGLYRCGREGILCFDPDASFAWHKHKAKHPDSPVGLWIEQQLAQNERRSAVGEPGLIDVLTEGHGFLRAVALRAPESFAAVSETVCGILGGEPA